MNDRFRGKGRIQAILAAVAFGISALTVAIGPVVLDRWGVDPKNAQGVVFGAAIGSLLYALLAALSFRARRSPVVRLFAEGVEVGVFGCGIVDGQAHVANPLALLIRGVLGEAGGRYFRITWETLGPVRIIGPARARGLHFEGDVRGDGQVGGGPGQTVAQSVCLFEAYVDGGLDPIVRAIDAARFDPDARANLPGWFVPAEPLPAHALIRH